MPLPSSRSEKGKEPLFRSNFLKEESRRSSSSPSPDSESPASDQSNDNSTSSTSWVPQNGGISNLKMRRLSPQDLSPYTAPEIYYGKKREEQLIRVSPHRHFSVAQQHFPQNFATRQRRRMSKDEQLQPKKFVINVDSTLDRLLNSEDTDQNFQITVDDEGPKVLGVGTLNSGGFRTREIRGTYQLSNLLQELTIAKRYGRRVIVLDEERLTENPVDRLNRVIRQDFWNSLTRCTNADTIEAMAKDPKSREIPPLPRIYIPHGDEKQFEYYSKVAKEKPEMQLQVVKLPKDITPEYVCSINQKPGLLALALKEEWDTEKGESKLAGVPYVVPGGRFNELYGWDSYMESLGLLVDGRIDLAKGMAINFCYEIKHYGKILNANRSYYLCRSQPPFLTAMASHVYDAMSEKQDEGENSPEAADEFLEMAIKSAIVEYKNVWMSEPRLDPVTNLSRYHPEGQGIPPETESSHFEHILLPFCKKYRVNLDEFQTLYNSGKISEPTLDEYFMHDRAVRESGHDTTYRLEGVCAELATIDLNSLLYKYEVDIAYFIRTKFSGALQMDDGSIENAKDWERKAIQRQETVDKLMWNEEAGMYFDYDTKYSRQTDYESATTLWPLWAGMASERQAKLLVEKALPKFEMGGGLASGTEKSLGEVGIDRPSRQWDYPYGWAPQQILAWVGLKNYDYRDIAERLVYRWLYMITRCFVDYNGVVVEKYNVTCPTKPHKVEAEYGNQGLDFKGAAVEGFGWVNASYQLGLTMLSPKSRRLLGAGTHPDQYVEIMSKASAKKKC